MKTNELSKRKREEVISHLQHYVSTYHDELFLLEETYVADMLYGIGRSLDQEKYDFANGFREFLLEHVAPLVDLAREQKNG
jgi:hypothetical protein